MTGEEEIFWDIVNNPLCKRLDWGSCGLMRTFKDMILLLEERYPHNLYAEYLIQRITEVFVAKNLEDLNSFYML